MQSPATLGHLPLPTPPPIVKLGADEPSDPPIVASPFTCSWAQAGLARAMDGMVAAGSGASGYGIGTRWVRYRNTSEHLATVDYWQKMVELYCGTPAPPTLVTGRDSAKRVIFRDV